MRAIVIINAASGVRDRQIDEESRSASPPGSRPRGVAATIRQVPGPELTEAAREAAAGGADAVVMAGGDGTMSAGAAALAGGSCPMGVLPLGTLNHFARDLGIPQDLDAALAGRGQRASCGASTWGRRTAGSSSTTRPSASTRTRWSAREKQQDEKGTGKWLAMARAAIATLRRFPVVRVTLHLPEGAVRVTTPLVFIGNNRYEMSLLSLGKREALDGGELWLYVASHRGRVGFVSLALRAVIGRLDQARDFLGVAVPEVTIEDRRRTIPIAFDGEVCEVESPLRCRMPPGAPCP